MRTLLPVLLAAVLGCTTSPDVKHPEPDRTGRVPPNLDAGAVAVTPIDPKDLLSWEQIDTLVGEQKLREARAAVEGRLSVARAGQDQAEWTRALIRATQLETALGGFETSVRFLAEQPWPNAPLHRAVLHLFYAHSILAYTHAYGWEIRQRERTLTGSARTGPLVLEALTLDQLHAEIQRAFEEVWKQRDVLGAKPIEVLKEYVEPNDYPRHVRDTLRDAVSYLRVELIADTSGWRPEHQNEIFRLDLPALLRAEPAWVDAVALTDPEVHPLVKVAAVLGDLERWHRAAGHREAELEAQLERVRRLHAAVSDADRRARIRQHLEALLPRYADVPWWSMGMSLLAELERDAGMLVRAHATAQRAYARSPESLGGKRCLHLRESIAAPEVHLSSMFQDAPGKRSIEISHKNLREVWLRAYPVNLERWLASARDYNLLPSSEEMRALIARPPAVEWKVSLPATPDFELHRTFTSPPVTEKGLYVVLASQRPDFGAKDNHVVGVSFIATGLAFTTRLPPSGKYEVSVVDAEQGEPVAGAEVELWAFDYHRGHQPIATERTDRQGVAVFPSRRDRYHAHFLVVRHGKDVALDQERLYRREPEHPSLRSSVLLYTDRSIYRPLQTVHWKAIAFEGDGRQARFRVLPQTEVDVWLVDANGQEVERRRVRTNAYGSASGTFTLPAGRLLGGWSLRSSHHGQLPIRVEEYKRPTFEVELQDPKTALRLNRPARLSGRARYYFGLPVTAGKVRWQVTREPTYPEGWYWHRPPGNVAQIIATGASELGPDGSFAIAFTPEADEPRRPEERAIRFTYRLTADVTDEGGETRSADRRFRLGWTSVEAQVRPEEEFFIAGAPGRITLLRTDLDGTPRAGTGKWRVVALRQPEQAAMPADQPLPKQPRELPEGQPEVVTEGDLLRARWSTQVSLEESTSSWADGKAVAAGAATHDAQGEAKVEVRSLPPGAYRLRYETVDDYGERFETSRTFFVAGDGLGLELPAVLLAQRRSAKVGEQARFLVHSGLKGQRLLVEVFRAGRRTLRRELRGESGSPVLTLPIGPEDRGGFTVCLTALRDHQLVRFSQPVFVPWDDKELKVEFATFRDKLRPGAKEKWRVTVRGSEGANPGAGVAELLAYMYDEALDAFAPHHPHSPLSLYPDRTGEPTLQSSLGMAHAMGVLRQFELPDYPTLRPDALRFLDGYGIGGPGRRGMPYALGGVARAMPAAPMAMAIQKSKAVDLEAATIEGHLIRPDGEYRTKAPQPEPPLRSNFAETAFWEPHLLTGPDGSAILEFTVPDSVTGWNVWVHAVTRDLRGGSATRKTRSAKELMVRPYVPRFLREGDHASVKVVVNNASDRALEGTIAFDLVDPETQKSVLADFGLDAAKARAAFKVEPGRGVDVSFPLSAPRRPGSVALRVTATSGALSDGELRPLPVLPSRMRLAQSRFVTLKDAARRELSFPDMARGDDPSRVHDQLVVSVDAQLFYTALQALPYLMEYPYECTEQTLNRFVSTGVLASMYRQHPAVAAMAKKLSTRSTRFETFDAQDPNRKLTLEESPWLALSRGGEPGDAVLNVLDPRIAEAERAAALAKLRKAQTAAGGFPWWPGGPPSPYMTVYILHGLARAAAHQVDVPRDLTQRAWQYVAKHYRQEYAGRMLRDDCCWELLTFLNYVASSFPDPSYTGDALTLEERQQILEHSLRHWKHHSPYLKGYLALTLKRMGRLEDAKRVFASVMDSAKTTEDQGTFWAPEDRAWLWYNDTVETHAFALQVLMELDPADARRHGLVHWLLLNKKLNHWKSTRATAEALYALVKYLKREQLLGASEQVTVTVGQHKVELAFDPGEYRGKSQRVVVPGPEVDPGQMSKVTVEKTTRGFAFASATWHFSTDQLPTEARGDFFQVSRRYFRRERRGREVVLTPLSESTKLAVGDELEVQLSLRAKHAAEYVHLRDPRAAGLEPENAVSRHQWDLGIRWFEETRDSGTNFFFEWLPAGEYTFKYRLRANMAGDFRVGPATVQSMYAPEFNAYSAGHLLRIDP